MFELETTIERVRARRETYAALAERGDRRERRARRRATRRSQLAAG